MSSKLAAVADKPRTAPPPVDKTAKPEDRKVFVLDTTARSIDGSTGIREHNLVLLGIARTFKFEPGKPLELPYPIALKFLRIDGFVMTDANGSPLEFKRRPKQPDELGAGEKIVVADDECIARIDELSNEALFHRCMEMPGGERFASKGSRQGMVDFMVSTKREIKKASTSRESDTGADEFTPEPEAEEE